MFKRRIAAFSAAIMLAICALVAEAVLNERNAAIDRAHTEAANLSAGFEEQVRGTLNAVSSATAALKRRIEADGAFSLGEWKNSIPGLTGPAIDILILNADGRVTDTTVKHDQTRFSSRTKITSLRCVTTPALASLSAARSSEKCPSGFSSPPRAG